MHLREFALLTADLSLAARLQTLMGDRARLVWCASVRDVREHLHDGTPAALVVDVPRRSSRMLRELQRLASRLPVVALACPHDAVLTDRCLQSGARVVFARTPGGYEDLLGGLEELLDAAG